MRDFFLIVGINSFWTFLSDGEKEEIEADSEEFKKQKKEAEDVVQPIIAKLYQGAGGDEAEDSGKDEL